MFHLWTNEQTEWPNGHNLKENWICTMSHKEWIDQKGRERDKEKANVRWKRETRTMSSTKYRTIRYEIKLDKKWPPTWFDQFYLLLFVCVCVRALATLPALSFFSTATFTFHMFRLIPSIAKSSRMKNARRNCVPFCSLIVNNVICFA